MNGVRWVKVEAHGTTHVAAETCDAELVLERGRSRLSEVIAELLVEHLLVNRCLRRCSCIRWQHELTADIHLWKLLRNLHLGLCLCLHLGLRLCLRLYLRLCESLSLSLCLGLLVLLLHSLLQHKLTLPDPG